MFSSLTEIKYILLQLSATLIVKKNYEASQLALLLSKKSKILADSLQTKKGETCNE